MTSWSVSQKGKRELHTRKKVRFLPLILVAAMLSGMLLTSSVGAEGSPTDSHDQVVAEGGTLYYSAEGAAATMGSHAISVSKTVEQKSGEENRFQVNLEVTTKTDYKTVTISKNSAVVLVVDLSGSMAGECAECGKAKTDPHSGHTYKARIDVADGVLKEFLKAYRASANGAKRYLSIVGYASDVINPQAGNWADIAGNTDAQLEGLVDKMVGWVKADRPPMGTDTKTTAAMQYANTRLDDADIADVHQRSVILMTDGMPASSGGSSISTESVPQTFWSHYEALKTFVANEAAKQPPDLSGIMFKAIPEAFLNPGAFGFIMRDKGAALYSVSFISGIINYIEPQTMRRWMELFSDATYDAGDADKLETAFTEIIERLTTTEPDTVSDALPSWWKVDAAGLAEKGATVRNGRIVWEIAGQEPIATSQDGSNTYRLSYEATLDNLSGGYPGAGKTLPVSNGEPAFTYYVYENGEPKGPLRTVELPVPTVKSYTGEFSFHKLDPKGNPVLKQAPEASIFALYSDPAATVPVATATNQGKGVITFKDVPSGHDYVMRETKAPDGMVADKDAVWTASVAWGVGTVKDKQGQVVTDITNYYDPQETALTVRKVWNDATNNYLSQTVNYTLTAHPSNKTIEGTLSSTDATSPGSKTWEETITVPTRDKDTGAEQYYTISEAPITGYTATYSSVGSDILIIVNDLATRSLKVTKEWEDPEAFAGVHPTVTVLVYAGEGDDIVARAVMQHNLMTGKNEAVINNLPVIDKDGQEIQYRVDEEMEYADNADDKYILTSDSGTMEDGYTLVNTNLKCETRSASLHIHWYGDGATPEKRPESLSVSLQQSTDGGVSWDLAPGTEVTLSAADFEGKDIWSHEYAGLPMYVESTDTEILYRASREDGRCAGYGTTYSDNLVDINNTLELTSVTVRKVWAKPSALPTPEAEFELYRSLPGGAEELVATYTMLPGETEHTFSDLPRTDGTAAYTYTVKEVAVDHYESIKDPNSPSFTNRIEKKFDVTVQGKINWERRGEQGDILPEEVAVQLWANGAPAVNPNTGAVATAVANEENGWTFEFKNALRYRLDGYGIVEYSVRELDKDGNPAPDASTVLFSVGGEEKDFARTISRRLTRLGMARSSYVISATTPTRRFRSTSPALTASIRIIRMG